MKQIDVTYNADGYIADMTDNAIHFEQEHESLQINATIATDKKVRAYIKSPNNNSAVTDELTPAEGVYSFTVDGDYMAKGTMYVGFELYDYSGYIERLEPVKIYIDSFVALGTDKNDNVYVVSVTVGEVETLEPDQPAEVENVGNKKDMILNFKIPRGVQGLKGDKGDKGDTGAQGEKGEPFVYEDFTAEQLEALRGPQGVRGDKGDKGDTPVKGVDYYTPEEIKEIAREIEEKLDDEITEYSIITETVPAENKTLSTRVISSVENITAYGEISVVSSGNENIPYYTVEEFSNPAFNIKTFKNNTQVSDNNFNIFYDSSTTDKVLRALPGYDYKDTLHMDSEKNYTITKKIRKAVLDGTEKWFKVSAHNNLFYCNLHEAEDIFTQTEINSMSSSSGDGLMSKYIGFSNWFGKINAVVSPGELNNAWMVNSGTGKAGYFTRLYIHSDEISTRDELTAKLSEIPFVFYYVSVDGDEIYNLTRDIIPRYINNKISAGTVNKVSVSSSLESFECTVKSDLKDRVQDYENTAGDIETALDSIIAMQNELIGGDA